MDYFKELLGGIEEEEVRNWRKIGGRGRRSRKRRSRIEENKE